MKDDEDKTAKTSTPQPSRFTRFKSGFCGFFKTVSSPIGLLILLAGYSFAGAFMFRAIEGPHETKEKYDIMEMRDDVVDRMWNSTHGVRTKRHDFEELFREELRKYEALLYTAYGHGINTDSEEVVWDIWGSLVFCTTIYTTVGYGHIAPVTRTGKIVTIAYALLGIPLCLIALAELGKLFTVIIKFLWSFVRRFYYTGQCETIRQKLPVQGLSSKPDESIGEASTGSSATTSSSQQQEEAEFVVDDEFNLPPIIAIVLTAVYIFCGAVMYMQWESEWDYLDAFYFIFISVSTIGFGDVLPAHKKYFLLSFLYQLFGLALVAMVINVIMEKVHSTIRTAKDKVVDVSSEAVRKVSMPLSKLQEKPGKQGKKD